MTYWTPQMVGARLTKAVSTLGQAGLREANVPCPLAVESNCSEATLLWFKWLQPEDVQLLWLRAEGVPWKEICRRFCISRTTAYRRQKYLLSVVAWKLNHHRLPTKWSRRFLEDRTQSPVKRYVGRPIRMCETP